MSVRRRDQTTPARTDANTRLKPAGAISSHANRGCRFTVSPVLNRWSLAQPGCHPSPLDDTVGVYRTDEVALYGTPDSSPAPLRERPAARADGLRLRRVPGAGHGGAAGLRAADGLFDDLRLELPRIRLADPHLLAAGALDGHRHRGAGRGLAHELPPAARPAGGVGH